MCSCVSSGGPRLERRRVCLLGADVLEDQGGCKGQKMTSDPSTPLSSVQLPAFVLAAGRQRSSGGLEALGEWRSECRGEEGERCFSTVCLLDWIRTVFKAIGAQINNVFICLLVFQFWIMLVNMYFCLFEQCLFKASNNLWIKPFYRRTT